MKITAVEMYGYKLSYAHGEYVMSGGQAATHQDSTLVRIITDEGIEGWGETATLSGTYLPTFCGKVGGISAAVRMRDQAQDVGIDFCIEDMWGGDVISAAVAHVAASSSTEGLMHASFFNDWTNEHVAGYLPRSSNGMGSAPTGAGLGISVDTSVLGAPIASFR